MQNQRSENKNELVAALDISSVIGQTGRSKSKTAVAAKPAKAS